MQYNQRLSKPGDSVVVMNYRNHTYVSSFGVISNDTAKRYVHDFMSEEPRKNVMCIVRLKALKNENA